MMKQKTAIMTDLHVGRKNNSDQHNQDCLNYINWFCSNVKKDKNINSIAFLGDWHENRSALNISTLTWSYLGAKKLNDLNLPVYFIIGNHDLFHRHTRETYSTIHFAEFSNFKIINDIFYDKNLGKGTLFVPFLFQEEYPDLMKHIKVPVWMGHFEFKGFQVTGSGMKMPTGPSHKDFAGPTIISGHFHKRQIQDNIVYMGNCFPLDFSDNLDNERGMMVYTHDDKTYQFINWTDCPKYIKCNLSELLDDKIKILNNTRITCVVDIPIDFEENTLIKEKFIKDYKLREFIMEESSELNDVLSDTQISETDIQNIQDDNTELTSIDDMIINMLAKIESEKIDPNTLIEIYKDLKDLI